MAEWFEMVKDVGFPIVVTLFLLYRIEAKLDELNDSIQGLPARLLINSPSSSKENNTHTG
ncbi:YvrJ family protein [Camelliibacillus cellulosilyticus]|uniref:YvrJ family protein n=1 Tax=Camelliibacillus cellulosilyticus TaxID=2174486 RepID=A0ABV9GNR9_9BACL